MDGLLNDLFKGFGWAKEKQSPHGSAAWGERKDYEELLHGEEEPLAPGALMVGPTRWGKRLDLDCETASRHVGIFGPSGSGKGRGFFLWNYAHYRGSILGTDPKSEAWELTSGLRERAIRFAPRDPDSSACFNWLPLCKDDAYLCRLLAAALVASADSDGTSDSFWKRAETIFLAALFAHVASLPQATPAAVYDFFTSRGVEELLEALHTSTSSTAQRFAQMFAMSDKKLRGNILIGVGLALAWLEDEKVRRFTSSSVKAPNFGAMRRQEVSVYWCLAPEDAESLAGLSALFFTLAFYQLKKSKGPVAVNIMLDEVAHCGRIIGLETQLGLLRAEGIGITLGLQEGMAQLRSVYGRDRADVILRLLNTRIYLAGLDHETSEEVSEALGEYTHIEESVSRSAHGWWEMPTVTKSRSRVARPLMTDDEVRRLGAREQIIITTNRLPLRTARYWFEEQACSRKMKPLGAVLGVKSTANTKGERTNAEDELREACKTPEGLR